MLFFIHSLADGPCCYRFALAVFGKGGSSFPPRRDTHGIGSLLLSIGKEFALCLLHHEVIDERQCHHGFHHGHGAGQNTGIVAALAAEFDFLAVPCDCGL